MYKIFYFWTFWTIKIKGNSNNNLVSTKKFDINRKKLIISGIIS